jgi:DNA-binding Xre family transcriptional regulator
MKELKHAAVLKLIGQRIADARHERGEKEASVAASIGITQAVISRIEHGSYEPLQLGTLLDLCAYLELPPEQLLA